MSRKDERGAVAVFVALTLPVLMGVAAFVVDIGMQRVTGADLQALVDVVALDMAREIQGGRTQADLAEEGDTGNSSSAVSQSVARNPDVFGQDLVLEVDWGSYDGDGWNTATNPPSAVRVTANANTDYAITGGTGDVTRTAYAVASNTACYRLGTFVAAIKSDDSTVLGPLNHLIGANLGLVSYRALADADVTLADLAATSAIGSPTQLLTGTVTYADVLRAMIEVLSNEPGSANTVAISALRSILAVSGSVGSIALGDVLHVAPTDTAALDVALNVLDIVGSARLATGAHFLEIPNLQAGVAGVGNHFDGSLALISAAQLACGKPNSPDTIARNAQLEGNVGIEFVNLPSLSMKGIGTLQTAKGTGTLQVDIADGEGQLVAPPEVYCGSGTTTDPHRYSVAVRTQPASYSLSADLNVNGELKLSVLDDLGLGGVLGGLLGNKVAIDIDVRLWVGTNAAMANSVANLSLPPNDTIPLQTGTSVALDPATLIPTATKVKIGGSTVPLGQALPLVNAIVSELTTVGNHFFGKTMIPLINNINNALVGPVARMVGLRFGGADVYAVGAVCGRPSLAG